MTARASTIWFILMMLTGLSVLMAEQVPVRSVAITAIFVVATLKAWLVIVHYMEANHAAPHWRTLYQLWTAAVGLTLIAGHLLG
jgi:phosphatidylserine synthase